jgi:ribosome-binding factor A
VSRRAERLAGEIRAEVARMIASDLKDPRLGFVTVTRVDLTADLRYARVYVGVLGEEGEGGTSLGVLRKASGFVRREIGRRLRVRFAPEIDFRYDRGLEATDRIARLLAEEKTAAPVATGDGGEDDSEDEGEGGGEDEEPRG